jgi:hypothetical protein
MKLRTLMLVLIFVVPVFAADSPVGHWIRKNDPDTPVPAGAPMEMQIEKWENSARLTYHIPAVQGQPAMVLTLETNLDGKEAQLMMNGKPSGETMSIKKIDDHHFATVIKMNGQQLGTGNSTFSDDFNTLTSEGTMGTGPNLKKPTEVWIRK